MAEPNREEHRPSLPAAPTPPARTAGVFLDREGRWFHEGVEITHERTRRLFSRSIFRDQDGGYILRVGRESTPVTVEDTPFLIVSVTVREERAMGCCTYEVLLNDGSQELLDPRTLTIEQDHVMYAQVRETRERARFLRSAYYQLCARIEYDEQEDRYLLPWQGKTVPIRRITFPLDPGL